MANAPSNPPNRGPLSFVSEWTDDVGRWIGDAQGRLGRMFEPTLRLGVTGLSRAGKTVFITSMVANLLRRGRLAGLKAEADGRIVAAVLTPQPDMDAPRFDYERHLADLYAREPRWPESTRAIGRLRIAIRYRPEGMLSRLTGDAVLNLDLVDYPGEWLLDLGLIAKSYDAWSRDALTALEGREALTGPFVAWLRETDPAAPFDEMRAQTGAQAFADYLRRAKDDGLSGLTPGRFLLPGDLEGAPALTFAPTRPPETGGRAPASGSFVREMARRYEAYKKVVVKPFFQDHFAKLDRQIVLVDALSAISRGPEATRDMGVALREILGAFRPGEKTWLASVLGPALGGRRIDRLLLAVTKADHIHHVSHPALQALARDLLAESVDRAAFKGAAVEAMAIAGLRATTETEIRQGLERLPAVRGRLLKSGKEAQLYPGEPPTTMAALAKSDWSPGDFDAAAFAPPKLEAREGEGPPHLRLDKALEFLIGDQLA